jgi:hypothetical protein
VGANAQKRDYTFEYLKLRICFCIPLAFWVTHFVVTHMHAQYVTRMRGAGLSSSYHSLI